MPTDKESHMDHSECLPTHVGGCQHGRDDCPRQREYLEDKERLRLIDRGTKAARAGQDLIDKAEGHDLKSNRVAVTLFMEVEGQWIDPENVAEEIVKYLVSGNPRGMVRPVRVEVPRGPDTDEVLGATVYSVQDAQEALRSFTITPTGRPYR